MRKLVLAALTAVSVLVSSLALAACAQGSGSENGAFPDRIFALTKGYFEKGDKGTYTATMSPSENCSWWIQLTILGGSAVKVDVYEITNHSVTSLSHTKLVKVNQESEHVSLVAGQVYGASFSYLGKAGVSIMKERIAVTHSGYTPHNPILITSDSEFTSENGVVSGSGIATDPYVIRGWSIATSTANCVEIRDTGAHFEIRDVAMTSTQANATCFINVLEGDIVDSSFTGSRVGVLMENCDNTSVVRCAFSYDITDFDISATNSFELRDCTLRGSDLGIGINGCFGFDVVNCSVTAQFAPCWASDSSHGRFIGNSVTLLDEQGTGLYLLESTDMTLYSNRIYNSSIDIAAVYKTLPAFNTHTIPLNNTANGKPILYQLGLDGVTLDGADFGEVILVQCQNVKISNMTFSRDFAAVLVAYSNHVLVRDNSFSLCSLGVGIKGCTDVQVRSNVLTEVASQAIILWDTIGAVVQDNMMSGAGIDGMQDLLSFYHSSSLEVVDNMLSDSWNGIDAFDVASCIFSGNHVSNMWGTGMWLYLLTDVTVRENEILGSELGMDVYGRNPATIYHNNFFDNLVQATDSGEIASRWDTGYPDGGNFWSDYTGTDLNGDGIGDTPYVISTTSMDMYPLMVPYSA
jgi:hypothetical protein